MIHLDAATFLLQWACGGMFFLWVTTRRREVGLGYGWLLRTVYAGLFGIALAIGRIFHPERVRDLFTLLTIVAVLGALVTSVLRRGAGVAGQRQEQQSRAARVEAMVGRRRVSSQVDSSSKREFPPGLDLAASAIGVIGLLSGTLMEGGPHSIAIARALVGALFLGSMTDAMLLGHWYLVQPGLKRAPLNDLNSWVIRAWPFEIAALLLPTGMLSVLRGRIDDGYRGILGWFWLACAAGTLALSLVTRAALREKSYSAVMAATGLLYLAILTGFGTDLVARVILAR